MINFENPEQIKTIENIVNNCNITSLTINPNDTKKVSRSLPIHYDEKEIDGDSTKVYYVSDIHLIHKIQMEFKKHNASYDEITSYIDRITSSFTFGIEECRNPFDDNGPILLIGGDVASDFELTKMFYSSLAEKWVPNRIIVILGNHELWGFEENITEIIEKYRAFFKSLRITFLHNELLIVDKCISTKWTRCVRDNPNLKTYQVLSMNEVEQLYVHNDTEQLKQLFSNSSYMILGGIGFSGNNPIHNASTGLYRNAIATIEEDKKESQKFDNLHSMLQQMFYDKQVIVFSHNPFYDWATTDYVPNWIYINGHTHHNNWECSKNKRVYADNQLGYYSQNYQLQNIQLETDYDYFAYKGNGIYNISKEEYYTFNRGKGLSGKGNCNGEIYMLKRDGIYSFFCKSTKYNKLYFLNGDIINKVDNQDLEYYYNSMAVYSNILKKISESRQKALKQISSAIKAIGGDGRIHGAIVDIDYYNHIYLNLFDGTITPYYALSMKDKDFYKNIPSLLKANLPSMYKRLLKASKSDKAALVKSEDLLQMEFEKVQDTTMYKYSLIMKRIQQFLDKNVIRIWRDDLFDLVLSNEQLPENIKKESE